MRESRTYGSVRGALSNERPYRDPTGRRRPMTGSAECGIADRRPFPDYAVRCAHGSIRATHYAP
jgi:hypothetical protein